MAYNNEAPKCDYIHAHPEIIQAVTSQMPDEELLYDLAELFKVFGDSTRIKILYVLLESEMCVCDIAQHEPEFHLPPASGAETEPSGKVPPGRKNYFLFAAG